MLALLVIALALGVAFMVTRTKVRPETPIEDAAADLLEPLDIPDSAARVPEYSYGEFFHHKETGEKIEILVSPDIVNGEYKIRWEDGSIGHIHQSSLKEHFE